jgi:hypothetical protein
MSKRCKTTSAASRFLRDDIQGDRILLPYLTTGSRLRLSECCHEMDMYRNYLSSVHLLEGAGLQPKSKRDLVQRVRRWKPGYLKHLKTSRPSSFVLGLSPFGCFQGLQRLHYTYTSDEAKDWSLIQAFVSRGLRSLEELYIDMNEYERDSDTTVCSILTSLGDACPNLRTLHLNFPEGEDDEASNLSIYVGSIIPWLPNLRELKINGEYDEDYESGFLLETITRRGCNLISIDLSGYIHDKIPYQHRELSLGTIGGTFLSGGFDSVEEFRIITSGCILLHGIDARQYPNMKKFTMWGGNFDDESIASLCCALSQGSFPNLEELTIPDVGPNNILQSLLIALRKSLLPNLKEVGVRLYPHPLFADLREEVDEQLVSSLRTEFPNVVLRHVFEC